MALQGRFSIKFRKEVACVYLQPRIQVSPDKNPKYRIFIGTALYIEAKVKHTQMLYSTRFAPLCVLVELCKTEASG